jgi:dTDP-4-amino-4,6-dideoxygalactose transaminase
MSLAATQRRIAPSAQAVFPFPSWPSFEPDEIEAAASVLRSGKVNYWTGQEGRLFEREFARSIGVEHAICLANGTLALESALQALGIGPGDEVITTSRTFIASASCVVMRGAHPVCVDVDPQSQNLTAETIIPAITARTRAIIAVHLAGWPCEMDSILGLARDYGLYVIEDCAQAQGAMYKGRPVGSMGHAAAFSFCQDKIMTTGGEGGMLVTNDAELWQRAWSFKDHGKNYDAIANSKHQPGFRLVHDSFGTNWRMTEMQSAIGRVALGKMPRWVEKRRNHAAALNSRLKGLPGLRLSVPPAHCYHSYYKYYVFVSPETLQTGWTRDRVLDEIVAAGVPCFSGSCSEIYLEKAFGSRHEQNRLPAAKHLGETSLMFLVHPTLSECHIQTTCDVIENVLARATDPDAPGVNNRHHPAVRTAHTS